MSDRCDVCQQPIAIGAWPWCPHGHPSGGVSQDTLIGGGRWLENLGPDPVWVESKSQLKREAAARGLVWAPDHGPRYVDRGQEARDVRGLHNGGAFPVYREVRKRQ